MILSSKNIQTSTAEAQQMRAEHRGRDTLVSDELKENELLLISTDLYSNDQIKIANAIDFFDNYLGRYEIPFEVKLKIQPFFIKILCIDEIPIQFCEPCLRVISSIATSFSDYFDYPSFFSHLLHFLPNSFAFDALAALITSSKMAAMTMIQPPFLPVFHNFFNSSNDERLQSGAIGIFTALSFHSDLTQTLIGIFGPLIDFHVNYAQNSLKVQCFEAFANLVDNLEWCDFFATKIDNLPRIFFFDSIVNSNTNSVNNMNILNDVNNINENINRCCRERYNEALLISSLRFLKRLVANSSKVNPEALILKSQTVNLILSGVANNIPIIKIESLNIIRLILKKIDYVPNFFWEANIPNILFEVSHDAKFSIWQAAIHSLCLICARANSDQVLVFIQKGFAQLILENIENSDNKIADDEILALVSMLKLAQSLNNQQFLEEIMSNDKIQAILIGDIQSVSYEISLVLSGFLSDH